jgi:prolyl-tRNA synthetase
MWLGYNNAVMYSIKLSELFTKTSKTAPADETARNARLLIQAGFVYKVMSGVYAYTPLGLQVLENIKQVVREEMNKLGAQELIMTTLQRRETWEATGRWEDEVVDIWFKTRLKDGTELGLAWSHEETIIEMMKQHLSSYKDLPANVYQFQTKMRNELRAKSGVMRGREFVMKDMYSCSLNAAQHDNFYNATIDAYKNVFNRLGIGQDTYVTFASGGAFTEFSHEFQTVCEAGEDTIYLHRDKNLAVNEEVLNQANLNKLGIKKGQLEKVKSAEVGNIFNFGIQKSQEMDFAYTDETGNKQYVHLGSYGIGITRLIGVLAEKFADEKGLVWPEVVAPARVQLLALGNDAEVTKAANELYESFKEKGINVIYDDRDTSAGAKFADADLMGMPCRVVVSRKTLADSAVELKLRTSDKSETVPRDKIIAQIKP